MAVRGVQPHLRNATVPHPQLLSEVLIMISGKRVLVTGGTGFLGKHLCQAIQNRAPYELDAPRKRSWDFTSQKQTKSYFESHKPDVVIHLAVLAGGIGANRESPGRFFYENAIMGINVMEAARLIGVEKFVNIGTICSYPKFTPVPFAEGDLWDGYPEETNAPYGIAKKAHLIHAQVNEHEYGQRFAYLIPTNLYGPGDKFHPSVSHVIPALIKKCVEAQESGADQVEVWGTGSASREYLYVDDAAEAIVRAAEVDTTAQPVNLGADCEITIKETVETIARLVGFEGDLRWDPTKPDGQPRRAVDGSRARALLGWSPTMDFEQGLRATIDWYLANRADAERDPHK